MGTPRQHICYEDAIPMVAEADIPALAPVYMSSANKVSPATSPAHAPILGVATEAVSAGSNVSIARFCSIVPMIADGAIALGSYVRASTTSGKISAAGALASPGPIVGIAVEVASANNDRIGVLIAPDMAGALGPVRVLTADGAITAGRCVRVGSADNKVAQCASASPTSNLIGVALNTAVDGGTVVVAIGGSITSVTSGAAVSRGAFVTSDASGKGIAAAPGAGTNCAIIGTALSAAGGADASFNVILAPGVMQG